MARKIGALISERTKKEFLREMYEESLENQIRKAKEEFYQNGMYDDCPVCGSVIHFNKREEVNGREYLVAHCDKCNKNIYANVRMRQSGDMFTGIRFQPVYDLLTEEQVNELKPPEKKKEVYNPEPHRKIEPVRQRFPFKK